MTVPARPSVRALGLASRAYMRVQGAFHPGRIAETFFGARLECDIRDYLQRRLYYFGIYEHHVTRLMQNVVQPGDTVLDLGANIGYFTLLASHLVGPSGTVLAVEADRVIHAALQRNLRLNDAGNVETRHVAVASSECRVTTHRQQRRNLGNTAVRRSTGPHDDTVPGRPLTDIAGSALSRTNFIKMDIVGAEAAPLAEILSNLDRMPARLTIAVELHRGSRHLVDRYVAHGFAAHALPSRPDIEYYLSSRLGRNAVDVDMTPVSGGRPDRHHYVLTRGDH